jgi:dATP pyrophosphohydrolase
MARYKIPVSVLVVVHTPDFQVLLLERADRPGYWQSVTGSQNKGETLWQTARREILEETGFDPSQFELADWSITYCFEIFPQWRHRYAPGVTENEEHVFGLRVPAPLPVTLNPREHLNFAWVPHEEAAKKVFSWSNAKAIRALACSGNETR